MGLCGFGGSWIAGADHLSYFGLLHLSQLLQSRSVLKVVEAVSGGRYIALDDHRQQAGIKRLRNLTQRHVQAVWLAQDGAHEHLTSLLPVRGNYERLVHRPHSPHSQGNRFREQ